MPTVALQLTISDYANGDQLSISTDHCEPFRTNEYTGRISDIGVSYCTENGFCTFNADHVGGLGRFRLDDLHCERPLENLAVA